MDASYLKRGIPFPKAARDFFDWCGEEYRFCTWGEMDLVELQRNLKFYGLLDLIRGPVFYYDIQKLFSMAYEDGQIRRSLEYGAEFLKIPLGEEFHRALADALYTARIFQKLDLDRLGVYLSVDTYQYPKNRKDEIYLTYPECEKYISRDFSSREKAMCDREIRKTWCPACHQLTKREIPWFSANPRQYYCISYCETHGYVKGKIRMKKTDDNRYYALKVQNMVSEDNVEQIQKKQDSLRAKRREKRHRKNG